VAGLSALLLLLATVLLVLTSRRGGGISIPAYTVSKPVPPVKVGTLAPDFETQMLDGSALKLSDLRGHPVWLNFWASWCVPCKQEMPDLVVVGRELEAGGGRLIGVNMGEDEGAIRKFLDANGYSLSVALDPAGRVSGAYKVYGLPTHVFIDSQGVAREVHVGGLTADEMREVVGNLQ
jgi:peroxiredoxin